MYICVVNTFTLTCPCCDIHHMTLTVYTVSSHPSWLTSPLCWPNLGWPWSNVPCTHGFFLMTFPWRFFEDLALPVVLSFSFAEQAVLVDAWILSLLLTRLFHNVHEIRPRSTFVINIPECTCIFVSSTPSRWHAHVVTYITWHLLCTQSPPIHPGSHPHYADQIWGDLDQTCLVHMGFF